MLTHSLYKNLINLIFALHISSFLSFLPLYIFYLEDEDLRIRT